MLNKLKSIVRMFSTKGIVDSEPLEVRLSQNNNINVVNQSTQNTSIKDGVSTYLTTKHSGALMISGSWGCGKSYFIKHELMEHIKSISCVVLNSGETSLTNEVIDIIEDSSIDRGKFNPIMVSVFGRNSISEIESAIKNEWLDKNANKSADRLAKIGDGISKLWDKSEKLKSWFDLSEAMSLVPKINVANLPRNTVIILDDLERMSDEVKEADILGFINNLSENIGFKVIVVANEEYLDQQHMRHKDFKEKVVEKTFVFTPDLKNVSKAMVSEFGDEEFSLFMGRESIASSLDDTTPFALRNSKYALHLRNLRTIRFAISHFFSVYKAIVEYFRIHPDEKITEEEMLSFSWYTILALAIELKSNNISSINIRDLDNFVYLDSMNIDFEGRSEIEMSTGSKEPSADSISVDIEMDDGTYKKWFYQLYFKSRNLNLNPIASPALIYYVVYGQKIDVEYLVSSYFKEREALYPQVIEGDKILNNFMQNLFRMSNEETSANIQFLYEAAKAGDFYELSQFINAGIYLQKFIELLPLEDPSSLSIDLKDGVIKWFTENSGSLNDYDKSRFFSIESMIEDNIKWLYYFIKSKIQEEENNQHEDEQDRLVELFTSDTRAFCTEICPQAFKVQSSYAVTYYMRSPILNHISKDAIRQKVATLTPADSNSLFELAKIRYRDDIDGLMLLKEEIAFWTKMKTAFEEENHDRTPGIIMAEGTLYPIAIKLAESAL